MGVANQAPVYLTLYYLFCIIALVFVGLRTWVHVRITKNLGWDDFFIIVAWLFLFAGLVLIQIEADLGLGKHIEDLDNPHRDAAQILRFNTFFQVVNVLCTLFTKFSISLFILRIKNTKKTRWILSILMLFMTLATVQCIIILCISCIPLEKLWDPTVSGTCLPLTTVYITARVQSAFTIFTDLCLTISPIAILWSIKIDLWRKLKVCLLMSLGLIATLSNALRNIYQPTLTSPDFTYAILPLTVLAILELCSGIIAACVPPCMPLFNCGAQKDTKSYTQMSNQYTLGSANWTNSTRPRDQYQLDYPLESPSNGKFNALSSKTSEKSLDDTNSWSNTGTAV